MVLRCARASRARELRYKTSYSLIHSLAVNARGGTPIHYLYGYVPPNGVVILKLLVKKWVSISETFSRAEYNTSNARKLQFVSSHLKLFKDRLLLKIPFNALTSKLLYSCCTLERSTKNWPISRTGYQS